MNVVSAAFSSNMYVEKAAKQHSYEIFVSKNVDEIDTRGHSKKYMMTP